MRKSATIAQVGAVVVGCAAIELPFAAAQSAFVNWESPHVHPIDLSPGGTRLLAVNTADNRLEVFDVTSGTPTRTASIPVGLDPVSVRARNKTEAWVVNRISDSVSIVDLSSLNVTTTLAAGDEPGDVVFAQGKAFVSVGHLNQVLVFTLANLALPPTAITIAGEGPRALATDGTRVYAAIFESGNKTTILGQTVVSSAVNPYPGDANPPPNSGAAFNPPLNGANPAAPAVGLIVKKIGAAWMDDNAHDWSGAVTWDLHDHDVAIINATSLAVTYASGLMNADMAIAVGPGSQVSVVGTDAINQVRFEPVVNGIFVRDMLARFDPASPGTVTLNDLNPHLTYLTPSVPQATRDQSVGDPRAIVWNAAGTRAYITGMGSNNLIAIDATGARVGRVNDIGQGPTGIALDEPRGRAYVVNKFSGSIAVIDTTAMSLLSTVTFYDPTPATINTGRQFLYNTHLTSGLGQASCAACHIDGRNDQIAWDLGNPAGAVKPFDQVCNFGLVGGCENWHPMKGPMTSQTLVGIIGVEPFHWRGDRANLGQFNPAFQSLLAADNQLDASQMSAFTACVASLVNPPNPNRNFDGSLKTSALPSGGIPATGFTLYQTNPFDGGAITCVQCHALPTGTALSLTSANALQESQSMKIPQLRNMHTKTGFDKTSLSNNRGFGFVHDGSVATLVEFLQSPVFRFSTTPSVALQQRKDLEAFMFSFSTDTHASVGTQTTVLSGGSVPAAQQTLINNMISLAQANTVGLVAKGRLAGKQRGWVYVSASSTFRSDRASEALLAPAALLALAAPGSELTYTVVPFGSQQRIGVDRDSDGFFDRTELDVCANPADPSDFPGGPRSPDADGDGTITPVDVAIFVNRWFTSLTNGTLAADFDGDHAITPADVAQFVNAWFSALTNPC